MERYAPGRHVHLEELLHDQPPHRVRIVESAILNNATPLREALAEIGIRAGALRMLEPAEERVAPATRCALEPVDDA